jgi:hypothetical protein
MNDPILDRWRVGLHVCHLVVVGCICNPAWALVHALAFQDILDSSTPHLGAAFFILSYVDVACYLCINIGIGSLSSHLRQEPINDVAVYFMIILIPFRNCSFIHRTSISVPALYVTVGHSTFFVVIYITIANCRRKVDYYIKVEQDQKSHVPSSVIAGHCDVAEYLGSPAFGRAIQAHDLQFCTHEWVYVLKFF